MEGEVAKRYPEFLKAFLETLKTFLLLFLLLFAFATQTRTILRSLSNVQNWIGLDILSDICLHNIEMNNDFSHCYIKAYLKCGKLFSLLQALPTDCLMFERLYTSKSSYFCRLISLACKSSQKFSIKTSKYMYFSRGEIMLFSVNRSLLLNQTFNH